MGGKSRNKLNKSSSRRARASASSSGNHGLFVEGGFLSDWSAFGSPPSRGRKGNNGGSGNSRSGIGKGSIDDPKSGSGSGRKSEAKKIRRNAFGYQYPQENAYVDGGENQENNFSASNPVVLVGSEKSPIVVYLDEGPVKESQNVEYMYDYTTSFTLEESSHRGLGFYDEMETGPDGIGSSSKIEEKESDYVDLSSSEEGDTGAEVDHGANAEVDEDVMAEMSFPEENQGYLLIGGTKIYTHDISDEEDEEEDLSDEESSGSSVSEDCSETSDSDGLSYSGSDVDDEVAADYFEGIGGISNIINVDQLVGQVSDLSTDDSESEDSFDETVQKLGGIDLQEASREYGMKQPVLGRQLRKEDKKSTPVKYAYSSALDDLMLVKDPRTVSGKKKHVARLPQSWPSEARKSKKLRRIPGEKKKHRKEMIAVKRRDRMRRRGVDLQKINLKLQQIVLDGMDMQSFPPMHPRDCSQALHSGVEVARSFLAVHIKLLDLLIGADDEDADFSFINGKPVKVDTHASNKAAKPGGHTPAGSQSFRKKPSKNLATNPNSKEAKKSKTGKVGSYAAQPLSFVSSGILNSDIVELQTTESNESKGTSHESKLETNAVEYGAFEMHTTGFGSKMMAKMGYVEGGGLGKDGQGVAKPIEVFQRPKSLGLGAEVPESNGSSINMQSQPKSAGRRAKSSGTNSKSAKSSGTNSKSAKNENQKVGSFEKHTKGFGSKMMAKMGFVEGMGLGRDSQGIVNPLVAVRRPKSMGLGAKS
ncbi:hypothetical protein DH2020_029713 [Rehmannia glutinosa]|uniref:G-patch domain-containing protein n=1 Tax=Rehmannia glutinosa TaxID=99300 RepID=A0ABR0VMQ8_REHGL